MQLYHEAIDLHKQGNRDEMFKKIRKAFFLYDHKNSASHLFSVIRFNLGKFYIDAGQHASAEFYRPPLTKKGFEYLHKRLVEKITVDARQNTVVKLIERNTITYNYFTAREINNLREWIKKDKGEDTLNKISPKLDDLHNIIKSKRTVSDAMNIIIDSEIGHGINSVENITYYASFNENFSADDLKLVLEYHRETFSASKDITYLETYIKWARNLFEESSRMIKNSGKAIKNFDDLIKALI